MQPEGLASYKLRKEHLSRIYSYEKEAQTFSPTFEKKFKANKKAWNFFILQTPSYQKTIIHWVVTAKQETTRLSRLAKLMEASAQQKRLI